MAVLLVVDPRQAEPQTERLREIDLDSALRLLVVGDFSGKSTGKVTRLDRDNFETVLESFAPQLELALGNGQLADTELVFRSLADFEPDNIYRQSELFAALRDESGQRLYSEADETESHAQLQPTEEQMGRLTSPGGLLDAIIERSSEAGYGGAAPAPKRVDEFQAMVERIVAPYTVPAESAESQHASAERAQSLSLLMAHVLHHPQFQALEAAWRGLALLVRGLDTDDRIQLYILDCSKEKLESQLRSNGAIQGERWGLLIGNFAFDRAVVQEVELLAQISLLAQSLGGPFIAEWLPSQQEDAKAESAWRALRKSRAASYIGLALPRFLLRLPYGKDTAPVDSFDFEEMPGEPAHSDYLWGNPAFACALALGQVFEQQGAGMRIPANLRVGDMPLHIFQSNGETSARPCTEVLLSEHDCETLLADGVLPVAAVKLTDAIVFPRMQSIADPTALLAGFEAVTW
jgi:type VI secretion system protein ImpC